MEAVGLGVDVGPGDGVGRVGRSASLIEEVDESCRRLGVAGRAAQAQPALAAGGGHRHRPAGPHVPEDLAVGHLDTVEEDLGEPRLPVNLGNRPHGDPGGVHGDEEVGQAAMAFCRGIGAEYPEAPFGEGAPAGPGLLAGEQPSVAVVVAHRPRTDAGQVAPGVGLRPTLTPDLLARGHRGQEALLLGRRPVLEHGRRQKEDAVLADPLGGPGAVVLLLEDEPLHDPDVTAAVLNGPAHHRPPIGEQGRLPLPGGPRSPPRCRARGGARAGRGP